MVLNVATIFQLYHGRYWNFTTDNTPYQEKAILETLLVINSLLSVYCLENLCSIKFIVSRIKIILTFSNWVQLKMFQ